MPITVEDVEYIARLTRLELNPEELQRFTGEIDEILGLVEKLKSVSTEEVPPTSHVLPLTNVYREDQTAPSLTTDQALTNAPDREGPFFRVPKVIDTT